MFLEYMDLDDHFHSQWTSLPKDLLEAALRSEQPFSIYLLTL